MKKIFGFIIFSVFIIAPEFISAQCSMCKAVVESGDNSELAEGVNNGILYMMGVPYMLMLAVGLIWYKKFGKTGLRKS